MKVIIVMTYYERPFQLKKTLESFKYTKHNDFEVVVVDDNSPTELKLDTYSFDVNVLRTGEKTWRNGVPAYNMGFQFALLHKPDVIIIQNAECYHVGDVITMASEVKDNEYISFGCFSIDEDTTFNIHDIVELLNEHDHTVIYDGQTGWYNHPVYRPVAYHFCSALTVSNLIELNGFDERFSHGFAYEDNYFLHQVRCLGLLVRITEMPLVVHQWHYSVPHPLEMNALVQRNRRLYLQLAKERKYKAVHTMTSDLVYANI